MAKQTSLGSLELTKLNKVFVKNFKSKEGVITPVLCIPIDANNIKEFPVKDENGNIVEGQHSNRFGIEIRIVEHETKDKFGRDGFIAQKLTKEDYEANKGNQDYLNSSQPIIGNFIVLNTVNPDAAAEPLPTVDSDSETIPF